MYDVGIMTYVCAVVFLDAAGLLQTCYKINNENYITVATYTFTTTASSCVIMIFGFIYDYVVRRLVTKPYIKSNNFINK